VKDRMMDIVGKAKKLERRIARSLEAAVGEFAGAAAPEPLEIVYQALDRVEQEIQHTGRGRRTFPFTRVRLLVAVPARDRQGRARFMAVADGPPSLQERLASRLDAAGVSGQAPSVEIEFVGKPSAAWTNPRFDLELLREAAPPPVVRSASVPELKLSVVHGKTTQRAYTFTGGRIDLGRRAEVLDAKGRLVRTNHVAFLEEGHAANGSVSRRHAHIQFAALAREYRLMDDRSAHGTGVVRRGRTISVHPGPRGVRLESGDEILLGQARLRVVIVNA
jgi:hypothetical protein